MVGIVVVSHSRVLADAAVRLAREMEQDGQVRIAVAAGLDDTTLGTDAMAIQSAIEDVAGPDGVLVLMDLGSAVLSAEMALEFLDDETRERVVLCPGPLVEGLIAASVTAAGGGSLAEVAAEASAALAGKQEHLASGTPELPEARTPGGTGAAGTERIAGTFVLANEHGLHARPAARLVAEVRGLDARMTLRNFTTGAGPVPAASISRIATLGALRGHEIEIAGEGPQARQAVDRVMALAARHFGEAAEPAEQRVAEPAGGSPMTPLPSTETQEKNPLPAVPGIAIGPVWRLKPAEVRIPEKPAGDPKAEQERLFAAVAAVRQEITGVRDRAARDLGESEAEIFDAHLALLGDPELTGEATEGIEAGRAAAAAWAHVIQRLEAQWAGLTDPYQRARAADVRAVGDQVLRALSATQAASESRDGVLVAADLTPAEAVSLDPGRVEGVVLAHGSPTAHSAILARTAGIPMIVAAGPGILELPEGTVVAFDGATGELAVDPAAKTLAAYRERRERRSRAEAEARAEAASPARTRDHTTIEVAANIGSVADARKARAEGADSAGLVRTEFLFLDRAQPPDAREQEETYRALAEAMDGRRLTLRTLDVGGDKPLPYLSGASEANPFLGLRGIRLSLTRKDLLRDQLTAICRVARDAPVSVMFPMVSTLTELRAALELLDEASGGSRPAGLRTGIMIEVPAAALKAKAFLPYVDFFSIGTNDLTQYALAAERGNSSVAALADPLDPAVLRLVDMVCRAASGQVQVAVCGEAASDETAVPLLLGLGAEELSVAPAAVPMIKRAVRDTDLPSARRLARAALDAPDAEAVRASLS